MIREKLKKLRILDAGHLRRDPDRQAKANLGCGHIYDPSWYNFDLFPCSHLVERLDLEQPLPFEKSSLEAIYCSHVLEHLPRGRAPQILIECHRVLRPKGVLRLVVPDLENLAREYLRQLEAVGRAEPGAEERHEWMTVELLDQLVRRVSGGFMARWWRSHPLPAQKFIETRLGEEAELWIQRFKTESKDEEKIHSPAEVYQQEEPDRKKIARFLAQGEIHRWMYDRVSLNRLFREAGFCEARVCAATESQIEDFVSYHLDTDRNGRIRKPDSLFMEALA